MRRLLMLALSCLVGVFAFAPYAFAQGSFCTTGVAASGESVATCVNAPSPTANAAASPEVTVISGGPAMPSPIATGAASGSAAAAVVAAVGGELPPTGGAGRLALMAAALLVGSGVMSFIILRRR